jgi:hypothetical protein
MAYHELRRKELVARLHDRDLRIDTLTDLLHQGVLRLSHLDLGTTLVGPDGGLITLHTPMNTVEMTNAMLALGGAGWHFPHDDDDLEAPRDPAA